MSTEQISIQTQQHEQPVGQERLYNLDMVNSVSGGDQNFIKKMVELFIETVPPNIADLTAAVAAEDWDKTAKLAHKLKSTIDSMGIKSLKTDIRAIEANAKAKTSLEVIPALAATVAQVIGQCVAQLQADIL